MQLLTLSVYVRNIIKSYIFKNFAQVLLIKINVFYFYITVRGKKGNYIFVNEYYDYMYAIGVIENIQGFVKVQKKERDGNYRISDPGIHFFQ